MAISLGTIFGEVRLSLSNLAADGAAAKAQIADVKKAATDTAGSAATETSGILSVIKNGIGDATAGIRTALSDAGSVVGNVFSGIASKAKDVMAPLDGAFKFMKDSFTEVGDAAKNIAGKVGDAFGGIASAAGKVGSVAGKGMDVLGTAFKGLALGAGIATGGALLLAPVIGDMVGKANDAQKETAQLNAALISTHDASGESLAGLESMAEGLTRNTTYSKETVESAEAMELTFTNIGKNVMPQATQTVLDMSTALGQDTKSSAMQLGKALNDPIKGIGALSRVGVTFTQEQKDQIKQMVKVGDTAGAQKIILGELSREFGGSAKAAGDTFAGGMQKAQNAMNESEAKIGEAFIPVLGKLMTAVTPLISSFGEELPGVIDRLTPIITVVGNVIGDVVTNLLNAGSAASPFHEAFVDIMNVAIPVGKALGGVVHDAIVAAQQAFQQARPEIEKMLPALEKLLPILGGLAAIVLGVVVGAIRGLIGAFGGLVTIITGAADIIAGVVSFVVDLFTLQWGKLPGDVGNIFGGIFTVIQGAGETILGFIGGFVSGFIGFFQHLFDELIGHSIIPDMVLGIISWIEKLPGQIPGILWGLVTGFIGVMLNLDVQAVSAAGRIIVGIATAITNGIGGVIQTGINMKNQFLGLFASAATWLLSAGGDIINGLIKGITGKVGDAVNTVKNAVGSVINGAKSFLGIGSPSKVFAGIGVNVMEGMSQGIDTSSDKPISSIKAANSKLVDAGAVSLSANLGATSAGLGTAATENAKSGSGTTYTNYITIQVTPDQNEGGTPEAVGQRFGASLGQQLITTMQQRGHTG